MGEYIRTDGSQLVTAATETEDKWLDPTLALREGFSPMDQMTLAEERAQPSFPVPIQANDVILKQTSDLK
jgi:hypothetical protein